MRHTNFGVVIFLLISSVLLVNFSWFNLTGDINSEVVYTKTEKVYILVAQAEPEIKEESEEVISKPEVLTTSAQPIQPEPQPEVLSDDTYLLAQIINAEARNQPYEGMVAVGNVILNRVASPHFPNTIRDVIYQKGQFSPVRNGSINKTPSDTAIKVAQEVMDGHKVIGEDILFFYNPAISTSKWIFTREVVTKIGDHAFAI